MNARSLRGRSKATHLLPDLLSFGVDMQAIQEKYFVCEDYARIQSNDFVVYFAYGTQMTNFVSMLGKRALVAKVDLVHDNAGSR